MGLDAGARLGPYEIVGPLGAGGMGDVYEGRDTRLNRRVAIKIIKGQFSDRFEREARAISALNHPHICTLHDMGTVDGLQYLVMEFIEGEPLSHQLRRGPLPLHDALRIASGIAAALDAAHRKGIVHRDLKPGNIMLTRTGAKLLDFGLARTAIIGDRVDAMSTVTAAVDLTAPGAVLGTPQYMAPEQLEGKVADHRTDIFAFGAVLFEILTGKRLSPAPVRSALWRRSFGQNLARSPTFDRSCLCN